MKNLIAPILPSLLSLLSLSTLALTASPAQAQYTIEDLVLTSNSISFKLSGSLTVDGTPTTGYQYLWLGSSTGTPWVNNWANAMSITTTGLIDGYNPETAYLKEANSYYDSNSGWSYVSLSFVQSWDLQWGPSYKLFRFDDGVNDSIDLEVSLTFAEGQFDPSAIDFSSLQLYWGVTPTGGGPAQAKELELAAVIPEPTHFALTALGAGLGLAALRFPRKR